MEYKVSEKVQKKFDTLTKDAKVQKALQFVEEDQDTVIDKQIELTLIPAPTNHEQKKAARLLEMFKEEGLTDCHIDEYGNCVGIRKGTGGGKTVLVEGHMDTVFPLDTKLEIVREDGFIKCPGIVDDTRGCATVLSTIRALNAAGIQTKGDIQFVGTVQEDLRRSPTRQPESRHMRSISMASADMHAELLQRLRTRSMRQDARSQRLLRSRFRRSR